MRNKEATASSCLNVATGLNVSSNAKRLAGAVYCVAKYKNRQITSSALTYDSNLKLNLLFSLIML